MQKVITFAFVILFGIAAIGPTPSPARAAVHLVDGCGPFFTSLECAIVWALLCIAAIIVWQGGLWSRFLKRANPEPRSKIILGDEEEARWIHSAKSVQPLNANSSQLKIVTPPRRREF